MEWWSDLDLGDLPTWLQAVVTAVALRYAYKAAKSAGSQARSAQMQADGALEQVQAAQDQLVAARQQAASADQERQERRLAAERAQAEACSAWADENGRVFLSNASLSPIYKVALAVEAKENGLISYTNYMHVVPPAPEAQHLPDFDQDLAEVVAEMVDGGADVDFAVSQGWVTTLVFTDSAGRIWERDRDGVLAPFAPPA